MISAKPEYIIPTFGVYVLDMDSFDCRVVQVGGTLSVSEDEECTTAFYFKCKDFDANDNEVISYVKINLSNDYKIFTHNSGVRFIHDGVVKESGITSVFIVPVDATYSREYLFDYTDPLIQLSKCPSKEDLSREFNYLNVPYTIETSVKANLTPFDSVS